MRTHYPSSSVSVSGVRLPAYKTVCGRYIARENGGSLKTDETHRKVTCMRCKKHWEYRVSKQAAERRQGAGT